MPRTPRTPSELVVFLDGRRWRAAFPLPPLVLFIDYEASRLHLSVGAVELYTDLGCWVTQITNLPASYVELLVHVDERVRRRGDI